MSSVLDGWLAAEGLSELRTLATVRACWADVVGAEVARHTSPRSLRDGALAVAVDHGGWATELRFQADRIVGQLAAQLGDGVVTRLDARVDLRSGLE